MGRGEERFFHSPATSFPLYPFQETADKAGLYIFIRSSFWNCWIIHRPRGLCAAGEWTIECNGRQSQYLFLLSPPPPSPPPPNILLENTNPVCFSPPSSSVVFVFIIFSHLHSTHSLCIRSCGITFHKPFLKTLQFDKYQTLLFRFVVVPLFSVFLFSFAPLLNVFVCYLWMHSNVIFLCMPARPPARITLMPNALSLSNSLRCWKVSITEKYYTDE